MIGYGAEGTLRWDRLGRDWPNRSHSAFVRGSAIRWHIQRMGEGPVLVALHGAGASTHSWRDVAPLLAKDFTVVAVDLPGHGFTQRPAPTRLTLPGMATAVAELLHGEGLSPDLVVGHSAGAAILCRMVLDRRITPRLIISLNGALRPFHGVMGQVYRWAARATSTFSPLTARWVASQAKDPRYIRELIERIGSRIDERGVQLYQRLVTEPAHTESTLMMMARWDLDTLEDELARLPCDLLLVAGARDVAVPSAHALHLAARLPRANATVVPDVGHLLHEEQPSATTNLILAAYNEALASRRPVPG